MSDLPRARRLVPARPELSGTFGMVASTHWLASAAGMAVLERGGNAFDAGVVAGLVLQLAEPHMNGPAGEVVAVLWSDRRAEPLVLCGQGPAPARASADAFRRMDLEDVPAIGPLAACVPGAFDAWMLLLRDFGTWRVGEVVELAVGYAANGIPVTERLSATIRAAEPLLLDWAASAELYLPAPSPGALLRNGRVAETYTRIVAESRGGSREDEIERAREVWSSGFVAEAVDVHAEQAGALLRGDDLLGWRARLEAPVSLDFRGLTICKPRSWSQGPVLLQQLALLDRFDIAQLHARPVELAHTVIECAKLAFADRDALYGDPDFTEVPLQ